MPDQQNNEDTNTQTVEKIIRNNLRHPAGYKIVNEFFTKTLEKDADGAKYSEPSWRLFSAKTEFKGIDDIVIDNENFVNTKKPSDFPVQAANDDDIKRIANEISPKHKIQLENLLFSRFEKPPKYDGRPKTLQELLANSNSVRKAVGKIINPHCVTSFDWVEFIDSVISWRCEKDERVKLFLKKDLLRGIEPRLNPVSICGKPPQTGMGEFYMMHCLHLGSKVTKKSFLGYATSPDEIYPGTLEGQDLTACVEQIESTDYEDLFGHLFTMTVQGYDYVSSGAVRFPVYSLSPLTFLSNIKNDKSPESDFNCILGKIANNSPAFLQRVSNILYEPNLKKAKQSDGATSDRMQWLEFGTFYRGIEELAMPNLRKWFKDKKIWDWSNQPIKEYEKATDMVNCLKNKRLAYALREHFKPPFTKMKGAALRVVFAEKLNEVLLSNNLDIQIDILKPAEEYLNEFMTQNITSISKITETYDEQKIESGKRLFENVFPIYLQKIVLAIDKYREDKKVQKELPNEIPIEEVTAYYAGCDNLPYLSSAILPFKGDRGKKSLDRYNQYLRTHFEYEIIKKERDLLFVHFL